MSNATLDLGFDLDSILGKNKSKTNFKYLEEGSAVYKILPSFDAANRVLSSEHNFHWVSDQAGKNIKVQCTYYTEKYCPMCSAHKELEAAYNSSKASDGEQSENTKRLSAAMQKLQKTKSIYYNAVTLTGEVVVLQLTKTASDLLNKKLVEAVKDKNADPTSLTAGYWYKFTKTGKGRDSVTVDFHRTAKIVEGEEVEVLNRTPFNAELIKSLPEKVSDIFSRKLMWIKEYTSGELADYLKGIPLKDKFKAEARSNVSAQASVPESRDDKASTPAPAPTPVMETTKESRTTTAVSAAENFAAEASRLRALAKG